MNCYFCPKCGVRILHVADLAGGGNGEKREITSFKGGVIDEGVDWEGLNTRHIFTCSAVMKLAEGWDCYERYPDSLAQDKKEGKEEGK